MTRLLFPPVHTNPSQRYINQVQTLPFIWMEIHFIITLPYPHLSSRWFHFLEFSRQIPAYFYPDKVSQPAMFRDTYIKIQLLNWMNSFEMNLVVTRSRTTENWKLNLLDIDKTSNTLGQHAFTELRMRTLGSGELPLVWSRFLQHMIDMRIIKPRVSQRATCFTLETSLLEGLDAVIVLQISRNIIRNLTKINTLKPGYNDIGLCNTPCITSHNLWCQLIPHISPQHYTPRLKQHSFMTTQNIWPFSWRFNELRL